MSTILSTMITATNNEPHPKGYRRKLQRTHYNVLQTNFNKSIDGQELIANTRLTRLHVHDLMHKVMYICTTFTGFLSRRLKVLKAMNPVSKKRHICIDQRTGRCSVRRRNRYLFFSKCCQLKLYVCIFFLVKNENANHASVIAILPKKWKLLDRSKNI